MEVDEIEIQTQVSKFQRFPSNGSTTTTDNSTNPQRIASYTPNLEELQHHDNHISVARLSGWPSSRIVRVSRASGGKDRHSKVLTSKGLRDRRVRLSVNTAIQFYDLQDRLGFDQPSKAMDWLLKAAATSIDELPSLDPPFLGSISGEKKPDTEQVKSPECSSTSSKGSGLSLSRSENRDRAREMTSHKKEKEKEKEKKKEIDSTRVLVLNKANGFQETSSFTDLLAGGININSRSNLDYIFNRSTQSSPQLIQMPQFNITSGENNVNNNHHHHHHQFSFLQDSFVPATTGGGECYNLNFAMTSSSSVTGGVIAPGGFGRGTLQSNLQSSSLLPHHLQRFQSDGSTSTNLPFFIVPNTAVEHYPVTAGYYGGDGSGRRSDQKEKSKN